MIWLIWKFSMWWKPGQFRFRRYRLVKDLCILEAWA